MAVRSVLAMDIGPVSREVAAREGTSRGARPLRLVPPVRVRTDGASRLRPQGPRPAPSRGGRRAAVRPGAHGMHPGLPAAQPVRGGGCAYGPRRALRLTARGRRLVVVLGMAGGVGLAALAGALLGTGSDGLHLAGENSVVVESGDTLWSIARTVAGTADVRTVVDRIQEMNGLRGSALVPGQVLELP